MTRRRAVRGPFGWWEAQVLIFERAQRSAHSQIDRIRHQRLEFLTGLADDVAVILEIGHALVQRRSDQRKAYRADPVDALFVFLDLLERDAERVAQLFLAHAGRHAAGADFFAERFIGRADERGCDFLVAILARLLR
jgi:hypothetical protein